MIRDTWRECERSSFWNSSHCVLTELTCCFWILLKWAFNWWLIWRGNSMSQTQFEYRSHTFFLFVGTFHALSRDIHSSTCDKSTHETWRLKKYSLFAGKIKFTHSDSQNQIKLNVFAKKTNRFAFNVRRLMLLSLYGLLMRLWLDAKCSLMRSSISWNNFLNDDEICVWWRDETLLITQWKLFWIY